MSEKIRLNNPNKFNVGVKLIDKPQGINIAPGSFTMVSADDIDFIMSTSLLLQRGILRVEESKKVEIAEQMGVDIENNANFMSDEDIKKKLSGTVKKLQEWLEDDIEPYVLERIADIASDMNLSMQKVQILQDKVPNYEFIKK